MNELKKPISLNSVESQASVLIQILTHFGIDFLEDRSPAHYGVSHLCLSKGDKEMVIAFNTLTAEGRVLSKS